MAHQSVYEAPRRKNPFPSSVPDKRPCLLRRCSDDAVLVVDVEDSSDEGGDGEVAVEERCGDRRAVRVSSSEGYIFRNHHLVDVERDCTTRCLSPKPLELNSGDFSVLRDHGFNGSPLLVNSCEREIVEIDDDDDDGNVDGVRDGRDTCGGGGGSGNDAHFIDRTRRQNSMQCFGSSNHLPFDFNAYMEQVQGWMRRMKMMSFDRNQACMKAQSELQHLKRSIAEKDLIIQSMEKARVEDLKKRRQDKFQFEYDLRAMRCLVNDYRKALKDEKNGFDEYRKQFLWNGGPQHIDTSRSDGMVLCNFELEKKRLVGTHELCFVASEMINDFQRVWCLKFAGYVDWFTNLARKLVDLDRELKILSEKVRGSSNNG